MIIGAVTLIVAPATATIVSNFGIHILSLDTSGNSPDRSKITTHPVFTGLVVRGSGNDPITGGGVVNGIEFTPHSALVSDGVGGLDIVIYNKSWNCGNANTAFNSDDQDIDIHVSDNPGVIATLQVGKSIAPEQVYFEYNKSNTSVSDGTDTGSLVVTRVDTYDKGTWHGILSVPKFSQDGKGNSYQGTFSARWCST